MIDIKDLIIIRYAHESDLTKSFNMPYNISRRILRKSYRKVETKKFQKKF